MHQRADFDRMLQLKIRIPMDLAAQRFERVVEQILEQDRAIIEGLFPDQILAALIDLLAQFREADALRPAAIGAAGQAVVHTEIRSDFITWWPDEPEHPAQRAFLDVIGGLSDYLNRTCFTGIRRSEFLFAVYPPGAHYERHVDDFQHKNARKFSVITYLNRDWVPGRGGELVLYDATGEPRETIEPIYGRTVIFPSPDVEHEVLPAVAERWSVTGWLR